MAVWRHLSYHDHFPLAPYTDNLTFNDLSPFNQKCYDNLILIIMTTEDTKVQNY